MAKYIWTGDSLPVIKPHSRCKHDILCDYLLRYILVLHTGTLRYPNKKFNVTIVDGFSGGGKYDFNGDTVDGSPFRILDVVREATASIHSQRREKGRNEINVDIETILVEKNQKTADFLKQQLEKENRLTNKVTVIQGDFNNELDRIITFIKQKSRGKAGQCLFFLDQYGYTQAKLGSVKKILSSLNAEIILTFAVDTLIDYLSDSRQSTLRNIGLKAPQIDQLLQLARDTKNNRQTMEHILAQHIQSFTGAKNYTPFFIRGDDTHRGYWLVHLSRHYRARDEMMNVHWDKANQLQHFGSAGIDMLSYRVDKDVSYTGQSSFEEFNFDNTAKQNVLKQLVEELPRFIDKKREVKFKDLMSEVANHTPAKRKFIVEALKECHENKVFSAKKRNIENIQDDDIICAFSQRPLIFTYPK